MPNSPKNYPLKKIYFLLFIIFTLIIIIISIIFLVDDFWQYGAELNEYDQYLENKYKDDTVISPQINKYDPVLGQQNAPIAVYLYSDFINPQTAEALRITKQLQTLYNNQVKIVFKGLPMITHQQNRPSLNAAYCANEQGKFWQYAEKISQEADPNLLDVYYFQQTADQLQLNREVFDKCLSLNRYNALLDLHIEQALYMEINTVPAVFINQQKVEGEINLNILKNIIDQQL